MKFRILLMASCLTIGLFSCSEESESEKKEEKTKKEDQKPEMHLKEMMRFMFNDMMVNREKILANEDELYFSFDYSQMPLAEATTPENKGDAHYEKEMAKFIELQLNLSKSRETVQRAEIFNEMKNTCVSCHQEYCIGPLRKIKKIHLLSNEILQGEQFKD